MGLISIDYGGFIVNLLTDQRKSRFFDLLSLCGILVSLFVGMIPRIATANPVLFALNTSEIQIAVFEIGNLTFQHHESCFFWCILPLSLSGVFYRPHSGYPGGGKVLAFTRPIQTRDQVARILAGAFEGIKPYYRASLFSEIAPLNGETSMVLRSGDETVALYFYNADTES